MKKIIRIALAVLALLLVFGTEIEASAAVKKSKTRTSKSAKSRPASSGVNTIGQFGSLRLMANGTATANSDYGRMKGYWENSNGCIAVYLNTVGGDGPNLGYVIVNGSAYQAEENYEEGMVYRLSYNAADQSVTRTCLETEYGDPYPPMTMKLTELTELSGGQGWKTHKGPHLVGETDEPSQDSDYFKTYFLGDGTALHDYESWGSYSIYPGYIKVEVSIPHASGYFYGGVIVDGYMYGDGHLGGSIEKYDPQTRTIVTEFGETIPLSSLEKVKVNWK